MHYGVTRLEIDKLSLSFILLLSLTAFSFILHFIFIFFLSFLYSTRDFEWVEKVLQASWHKQTSYERIFPHL